MWRIDQNTASYAEIGKRLCRLRRALGFTQRQLADRLNMTHSRWANYEVGTSRIPVDAALKLVETWNISLDWIYYGNRAMMPQALIERVDAVALEGRRERRPGSVASMPEPPQALRDRARDLQRDKDPAPTLT